MSYSITHLHHLCYTTTILVICVLLILVFFAKDLHSFEEKCRSEIDFFKEYETQAWDDIITLEKIHTRSKRQTVYRPIRKSKKNRKTSRKRISKKYRNDPQRYTEQLVDPNEYANTDRSKEVIEQSQANEDAGLDGYSQVEFIGVTTGNSVESSTQRLTISKSGLPQLLEIHNDKNENEEEEESEGQRSENIETDGIKNDKDEQEDNDAEVEGEESNSDDGECADDEEYCYGNPCPRGEPGPPGDPGIPGEDGPDGINGTDGGEWALGMEDRVVVLGCVKCPAGPRGNEGDPGPPGDKGGPGQDGTPGLDGYEAYPGGPGPEGYVGDDGDYGADGWPGPSGENALRYANLPGNKGIHGIPGEQGEVGEQGKIGVGGLPGIAGSAGAPGKHGIPGPPGRPGLPGDVGTLEGNEESGHCSCPPRKNEYPTPPPYPVAPPIPPIEYIITTTEEYITSTEEPTTSPYRYYIKAEVPTSESTYEEPTTSDYAVTEEYYSGYKQQNPPEPPVVEYHQDDAIQRPAIPTDFLA